MSELGYRLGDKAWSDKTVALIADYVTNSLDYNLALFKDGKTAMNDEIQFGISLLSGLTTLTKTYNPATSAKYKAKLDGYVKAYGVSLNQ